MKDFKKLFEELVDGDEVNVPMLGGECDSTDFDPIWALIETHCVAKSDVEKAKKMIDEMLLYCREQNGRNSCKNCGLSEDLKDLL